MIGASPGYAHRGARAIGIGHETNQRCRAEDSKQHDPDILFILILLVIDFIDMTHAQTLINSAPSDSNLRTPYP